MYFRTTSARSGVRLKRVSAPDLTFTPRGRCICSSTARSKGGDRTNGRSTEGVVAGLLDRVSIGARADLRTRGKGKTQDQQRKRNCAKSFPIVIHNGFTRQCRRELVLLEQELVEFTRKSSTGRPRHLRSPQERDKSFNRYSVWRRNRYGRKRNVSKEVYLLIVDKTAISLINLANSRKKRCRLTSEKFIKDFPLGVGDWGTRVAPF